MGNRSLTLVNMKRRDKDPKPIGLQAGVIDGLTPIGFLTQHF